MPLRTLSIGILLIVGIPIAFAQDDQLADLSGSSFGVAVVRSIVSEREDNFADFNRTVQTVELEMIRGVDDGTVFTLENGIVENRADMTLHDGDKIVIEKVEKIDGESLYLIKDKYRLPSMGFLLLFFFVLSIMLSGRTGVTSILGLAVSILLLVKFIVPMIIRGSDPLTTSLFGAAIIAVTSIYLAHGFSKRTSVALLSTLVTLTVSAIMAVLFVHVAQLFGTGTEESLFLQTGPFDRINLRGLLLGGIIIGALGVLDDITTAQTAVVAELKKANPRMGFIELHKAGLAVGREHIASLINTLALAYVGSSLPLLLLFTINASYPLWVTLNSEFIAEEIIRTLVGSVTLLLAVPISTWFAAYFLKEGDAFSHHNHVHLH